MEKIFIRMGEDACLDKGLTHRRQDDEEMRPADPINAFQAPGRLDMHNIA